MRGNSPDRTKILFDELNDYALMNSETFHQLQDYSKSVPGAVYAGKMWRGSDDKKTWFLHWWTDSEKAGHFIHNIVEIIITD